MDQFRATLEATYDALDHNLSQAQAEQLQQIFAYYDNERNGSITAGQAQRILQILGLESKIEQSESLDKLGLRDFMKIANTKIAERDSEGACTMHSDDGEGMESVVEIAEREWRVLNTLRSNQLHMQDFKRFVHSSGCAIKDEEISRIYELYGDIM